MTVAAFLQTFPDDNQGRVALDDESASMDDEAAAAERHDALPPEDEGPPADF